MASPPPEVTSLRMLIEVELDLIHDLLGQRYDSYLYGRKAGYEFVLKAMDNRWPSSEMSG